MGIGVYRIYVSHSWGQDGAHGSALAKLVAALDANTAFLYRLDRLLLQDLSASLGSESDERGAIRVAMTQSHVMLVPIAASPVTDAATAAGSADIFVVEQELARSGFRRRIPILGVRLGEVARGDAQSERQHPGVDRVVDLETSELACTIQDLAEEAAAERRQANAIALARPLRDTRPDREKARAAAGTVPGAPQGRALPVDEIMEAYQRLVATRTTLKPGR